MSVGAEEYVGSWTGQPVPLTTPLPAPAEWEWWGDDGVPGVFGAGRRTMPVALPMALCCTAVSQQSVWTLSMGFFHGFLYPSSAY